jgi:hypothetical protein
MPSLVEYLTPDVMSRVSAAFVSAGIEGATRSQLGAFLASTLPEAWLPEGGGVDEAASAAAAAALRALLAEAFPVIDTNNDGTVSFNELIDYSLSRIAAERVGGDGPPFRFVEIDAAADRTTHSMRVRCALPAHAIGVWFVTEEDRSRVTAYSLAPRGASGVASGYEILATFDATAGGAAAAGASILAIEYIEEVNLLLLSMSDSTIQFWDCRPLGVVDKRRRGAGGEGDGGKSERRAPKRARFEAAPL